VIQITLRENRLILPVRVTPRGGKDLFLPFQSEDEWIRLKVKDPPEDGKANAAVIALFAQALALPKRDIEIIRGIQTVKSR
jgi:uncharacterized protein